MFGGCHRKIGFRKTPLQSRNKGLCVDEVAYTVREGDYQYRFCSHHAPALLPAHVPHMRMRFYHTPFYPGNTL
jgi:hypothetical protein